MYEHKINIVNAVHLFGLICDKIMSYICKIIQNVPEYTPDKLREPYTLLRHILWTLRRIQKIFNIWRFEND